ILARHLDCYFQLARSLSDVARSNARLSGGLADQSSSIPHILCVSPACIAGVTLKVSKANDATTKSTTMNSRIIAPPLAGNILGSPNDSFVVAEWQDAGGPPGPPPLIAPRHRHHAGDEAWYVLEGTLCVQVGDKDIGAPAGSAVLVPRGTPHAYWNPGPGRLRYLL